MLQGGHESLTDRQADRQTDKANPIYPLTSLRGYKKAVLIFKLGSIGGTKIRNKKVSTTIKKYRGHPSQYFLTLPRLSDIQRFFLIFFFTEEFFTEFPDFSLTLKNKKIPRLFPDCWQPCRNICSQKLEHLNTGFLWTMPHALKWYSHMVFVCLPLLYYSSSNIVVFRSQKRF